MDVYLHGFDWSLYAEQVMPAFERWLMSREEGAVYHLFAQTRCALEEEYLPAPMRRISTWVRAKEFVDGLPRGPHSRKEYVKLCSAEQFTAFSDRFLHQYTPQLYKPSPALRGVWGAIVETHCLTQFDDPGDLPQREQAAQAIVVEDEHVSSGEVISLLHNAGQNEVAREFSERTNKVKSAENEDGGDEEDAANDEEREDASRDTEESDPYADDGRAGRPVGIMLGHHINMLRLRGWLASISVRAMALFELLACGRRQMPFGYDANDPYGAYYGYLTPGETWQLATALLHARPYNQSLAEKDYQQFCLEQVVSVRPAARLVDEALPEYSHNLLRAVRQAATHGTGLICVTD